MRAFFFFSEDGLVEKSFIMKHFRHLNSQILFCLAHHMDIAQ